MKTRIAGLWMIMLLLTGCASVDVTSYERRKPLDTEPVMAEGGQILWLPMLDDTYEMVTVQSEVPGVLDEDKVWAVYQLYREWIQSSKHSVAIPGDLALSKVKLRKVQTARHFNHVWELTFNESLLQMPEGERSHFLAGLTKTLIEGNENKRPQTNFSGTRIYVQDRVIGYYEVFHT